MNLTFRELLAKKANEKDIQNKEKVKLIGNKLVERSKKQTEKIDSALEDHKNNVIIPKFKKQKEIEDKKEINKKNTKIELPKTALDSIKLSLAKKKNSEKEESKEEEANNKILSPALKIPEQKKKSEITYDDLNEKQKETIDLAETGTSLCLIGAAGTGKTTTQRVLTETLYNSGRIPPLTSSSKKFSIGSPAILICSFTNKAVENIRSAVPEQFKSSCMTIHKAIEMAPEYYEEENEEGMMVKKKRFVPMRNKENPLPEIKVVVIEEASTVGLTLFLQLMDALPEDVTLIFLGDLNQLPPVMDDAILGFALNHLPVVELTEVYRQALESPIISFAYNILEGKPLKSNPVKKDQPLDKLIETFDSDKIKFIPFMKYQEPRDAVKRIGKTFQALVESEKFDIENSVVLLPFNTGGYINVENINKYISQGVTNLNQNPVYEIIAGWNKLYYSVGDILFAKKSLFKITSIERNEDYFGITPVEASVFLNRWGIFNHKKANQNAGTILETSVVTDLEKDGDSIFADFLSTKTSGENEDEEEKKNQGSHIVYLESLDDPEITMQLRTSAEFNEAQFGYALTVHKSQGSEWKNVYMILANEHNRMINRELLYTGVTRARDKLSILYQPNSYHLGNPIACTFQNGIVSQKIKGKSLKAKLDYFTEKENLARKKVTLAAKVECRELYGEVSPQYLKAIENRLWEENAIKRTVEILTKEQETDFVSHIEAESIKKMNSILDKKIN